MEKYTGFSKIFASGTLKKGSGNHDLSQNRGLMGLGVESGLPGENFRIAVKEDIDRVGDSTRR
jgi:hypothetical protein